MEPTRLQQAGSVRGPAVVEGSISLGPRHLPVPPQHASSQVDTERRHDWSDFLFLSNWGSHRSHGFSGQTWSLPVKKMDNCFKVNPAPERRADVSLREFKNSCFHCTWPGKTDHNNIPASPLSGLFLPQVLQRHHHSDRQQHQPMGRQVGAACLSAPGITPHPDREDETPLGLMRAPTAAARVTGLCVQRKTWSNRLMKTKPGTRTASQRFIQSIIIPDNKLRETLV